uniref:Centromere protein Q n=1 Tax=Ditylenchus dipsaci TaxID=166011 RepID=A0A915EKF5_9BILA
MLLILWSMWSCGAMDNALVYGTKDCRKSIGLFIAAHKTAFGVTALVGVLSAAESQLGILQSKFELLQESLEKADADLDRAEQELAELEAKAEEFAKSIRDKMKKCKSKNAKRLPTRIL